MVPQFSQQVVLVKPAHWSLAYRRQDARTDFVQFQPDDPPYPSWHEMIGIQAYRDLARISAYGPQVILRVIRSDLEPHCRMPLVVTDLGTSQISGYPAYGMLMGCPEARDSFGTFLPGLGEMSLYVAIKGRNDLYVIQRARRTAAFSPEHPPITASTYEILLREYAPLLLCEPEDSYQSCTSRPYRLPGVTTIR